MADTDEFVHCTSNHMFCYYDWTGYTVDGAIARLAIFVSNLGQVALGVLEGSSLWNGI